MFISSDKIARKIIDLLANMNISSGQWKYQIPDRITEEHMGVIANAKNLADGINYSIERIGIEIPEDLMIYSSDQKVYINNEGKRINGLQ